MVIFRSLETLPINNYMKVVKTGELRWLLKLSDYNFLPEPKKKFLSKKFDWTYKELTSIWEDLGSQFEENTLDLKFPRMQYKLWELYFDYVSNHRGENKLNTYFAKVKEYYDTIGSNFSLQHSNIIDMYVKSSVSLEILGKVYQLVGMEFETFSDLYNNIKKIFEYKEFVSFRMVLLDNVNYIGKDYSFIDEVTEIENTLKIQIDINTCSVARYMSYKKKYKMYSRKQDNI